MRVLLLLNRFAMLGAFDTEVRHRVFNHSWAGTAGSGWQQVGGISVLPAVKAREAVRRNPACAVTCRLARRMLRVNDNRSVSMPRWSAVSCMRVRMA